MKCFLHLSPGQSGAVPQEGAGEVPAQSGQGHPQSGEHPGLGGEKDPAYSQLPGQLADVQAARAAKAHQGEVPGIITPLQAYRGQGLGLMGRAGEYCPAHENTVS